MGQMQNKVTSVAEVKSKINAVENKSGRAKGGGGGSVNDKMTGATKTKP